MPFKKNHFFQIPRIAVMSVFAAIFICLLVLCGWTFNIPLLQSFNPAWPTVKANTAIGILFLGISLFLIIKKRNRLALFFAAIAFLLGTISFGEHIFSFNAHIDEVLFIDKGTPTEQNHGRMPLLASFVVILTSIALFIYPVEKKWARRVWQFLIIIVFTFCFAGFIGALLKTGQFFQSQNLAAFSIPATLAGLLVVIGIICSKPNSRILSVFQSDTIAAKASLRGVFVIIIILIAIGWLCLKGVYAGLFNAPMGFVIMIAAFTISFLLIALSGILRLNKSENQLIASEENLRHVLSSTADVFYVIDKNYKITLINKMAERNLSMAWGKTVRSGINILDVIPNEKNEPIRKSFEKVFKGEKIEYELHQLKRKDLPEWVLVSYNPVVDNDGIVIGAYIVTKDITTNKKAEEGLKQSNNRFELISRTTNDAIWEWDLETGELWSNATHQELYGLSANDPVPKATVWAERIHPDEREIILKKQEASLTSDKNVFITEYRFNVEGKGYRNIYDRCYIVRDENGKAIRMMGSMIDVTEQKEIEDELRRSKERYRSLIEQASDYIMITDTKGNFTDVNSSLCKTFGYTREELLAMNINDIIDPLQLKRDPIQFSLLMEGKTILRERRMMNKDGTIIEVEANVKMLPDGRVLAIARNIGERKKAEEALSKSENLLRTIVQAEPECVKLLKKNCELEEMNSAGLAMIEADNLEQVKGKSVLGIINEKYREDFEKLTKKIFEGKSGTLEFEITGLKGTRRRLETHAVPLKDRDGKIIFLLGVTRDITERKKTEEELRRSEERYRSLVENATEALVVFDIGQEKFVSVSESAVKLFKMSKEELLKIGPVDLSPEYQPNGRHSSEMATEKLSEAIAGYKPSFEWMHCDKDGILIPCEVRLVRLPAENQILIRGAIVDISERKKAEEAIRNSEETRRLIMDSALDAIIGMDTKGAITVWTPQAEKIFGWQEKEVIGKTIADTIIPQQYREQHKAGLKRYLETGKGIQLNKLLEVSALDHNGREFPIEISIVPVKQGETEFFCAFVRDITDRIKAKQLITKEKELSDSIINSMPGVFYLFDKNGKYKRWNKFKEIITGYSHEEIQQMSPLDFFEGREKEHVRKHIEECFRTGETNLEAFIVAKDGTRIPFFLTGIALEYEGEPCLLGTGINIADRKKAEEEVQQSYEAIRKLTEHLQNIREEERSHIAREIHDELGQQLTVLKMDASWLNKKLSTTDENIKEKLRDLLELLDGTVRTVRKISSELRPSLLDDMGLVAAMEWHLKEFEKRMTVKTKFSMPSNDLPLPDNVKTGLFRIFQESLTNVARHANAKKVEVSLQRQNGSIILSIKDDGKGFDREKAANKKTLGILGMEERSFMMGGNYQINSKPGKGTLVVVSVPYTE